MWLIHQLACRRAARPEQPRWPRHASHLRHQYAPSSYPIQPKPFNEVTLADSFWRPRTQRNAEITIPFEIQKFREREHPTQANVLEAAIYSLKTYTDPARQQQVETGIKLLAATPHGARLPALSDLRVASAYSRCTGNNVLPDVSIKSADTLYRNFQTAPPPFSGGERDAMSCIALYTQGLREMTGRRTAC